jgi:hypothetical protein
MIFGDDTPKEYMDTQPPILSSTLTEICDQLAKFSTPKIDGAILSNLLKLCYYLALKRSELVNLRIGDVEVDKLDYYSKLKLAGSRAREIFISEEVFDIIESQLKYLKRKRYKTNPRAPLFPAKSNKKYEIYKLKNHLSKFCKEVPGRVSLEKIRQAGACRFYEILKEDKMSPEECLRLTADFLGVDKKQAYGILSGQIQPTGAKKPPRDKHFEEIARFKFWAKRHSDFIRKSIDTDTDLGDGERLMLKDELSRVMGTRISSPVQTTPVQTAPSPLIDTIKEGD